MDLREYQGKRLLLNSGVAVPRSWLLPGSEWEYGYPLMVKAQVRAGHRGKRGLVRFCRSPEELPEVLDAVRASHGSEGVPILLEKWLPHTKELYISITISRYDRGPMLLASPVGGTGVEGATSRPLQLPFDIRGGPGEKQVRALTSLYSLDEREQCGFPELVRGLFDTFTINDLLLLEINPLVFDGAAGVWTALDCKAVVDDDALWRHPEIDRERRTDPLVERGHKAHLAVIPGEGEVAVIANGAGLSMAVMDSLAERGLGFRLLIDLAGTNDPSTVAEAVRIASDGGGRAILLYMFGGMTKADTVARGLLDGLAGPEEKMPVVARIDGGNVEQARKLLAGSSVIQVVDMEEAVDTMAGLLKGGGSNG